MSKDLNRLFKMKLYNKDMNIYTWKTARHIYTLGMQVITTHPLEKLNIAAMGV